MRRNRWVAAALGIFLFAGGSGQAQVCVPPQPFDVDPVNGNFSPISWPDGSFNWVNNAVGAWLSGVWTNTDFDVWFVGLANGDPVGFANRDPIAAHFDGASIQPSPVPGPGWLSAVWGSASNDVWAVGFDGLIVHWDGTLWVRVPSGTDEQLNAVAGTASDDVWAASGTVMLHWDGSAWTNSPGFVPDSFPGSTGLAAISRNDALVATDQGCQRWDGARWNATPCGVRGGTGIYAPASNDVWVIGHRSNCYPCPSDGHRAHWDGSSWTTTMEPSRYYASIAGTGPSDIWIDGQLHYDGFNWTESCGPQFNSMSASNNGAIIGVNGYGIEYLSGNDGWPFLARTLARWVGLGGRDPANLWAVGENGEVIVYDGSRWSGRNFPFPSDGILGLRAFGSSSSDIWASAERCEGWFYCDVWLRHFDGNRWSDAGDPFFGGFSAGFSRSPNDAIVVDVEARAWHWNGARWSQITLPIFENDLIYEFWGTATDDVWAVGGNYEGSYGTGAIYHWDGDSWERMYRTAVGVGVVTHVAGTARDDVWFSLEYGSGSSLLHWDGSSILERHLLSSQWVDAIAASGPNDVWFLEHADGYSIFTHYDGSNWANEAVRIRLNYLWGLPGAGVFALGASGQIYQRR